MARESWGMAHAGALVTREDLARYDAFIKDALTRGMSLYAMYQTNRPMFACDVRTLYNYINKGLFRKSKRGDQPRACMIKPRKKKGKAHKVDRTCRKGRTYEDFVNYLESDSYAIQRVSEMDTIEGRKGGKVIFTFFNIQSMMMFGVISDHQTAWAVCDALMMIHSAFLDVQFPQVFGILLGDNGTEFTDPVPIEDISGFGSDGAPPGKVFYCDPGNPRQKGAIERNHEEMRKILIKGVSFDNLTQADVNLVLSHVNSYPRQELGGMSAFEMFRFVYGDEYVASAKEFGLEEIPPSEINLTPALISDIARQVIDRARRIVEEEEVSRKAVETLRVKRGR
jgi:IS30 family transposase